jgi:hypothetical protein
MTDLQVSLLIIGATIVVGVISYNKWQEIKARKSVQKAFASDHDDVLMESSARKEPVLEDDSGPTVGADANHAEEVQSLPVSAVRKDLPIDELVDCAISLVLDAPVRGDKVLPKLQALRHVGNKPVHFVGQREDGGWEEIGLGGTYFGLYAGVQLANRSSALNELEYSELITRLRQVCDELDAEPDVPDMNDIMKRSRALQQFVLEYDAQLSISVQSKGPPWAIGTLLGALERHGFDIRPDGRLVMPDGDGGVLFSVSTNVTLAQEATPRLTLLLDVPLVAPLRDGFGAMSACARMLAARLDGEVVDDSRAPLAGEALVEIAEQVQAFYSSMEAANVPAGSTRALRLFS